MNFKKISIITYNILLILLVSEGFARIAHEYQYGALKKYRELKNSDEISDYLKYVNHSRSEINLFHPNRQPYRRSEIIKYSDEIEILNKNKLNFYIYSEYSKCKQKDTCKTILLQGDSWGYWIERTSSKLLFSDYINKGYRVISMGTGSFSPSNFSGQLAYLKSKSIKPSQIITFIDQTDLADDSIRYWENISSNADPQFIYVKQFNKEGESVYVDYGRLDKWSDEYNKRSKSIRPIIFYIAEKVLKKTGIIQPEKDLSPLVGKICVTCPLETPNEELINRFKFTLKKYLISAQSIGTDRIYLFTHPHKRHLTSIKKEKYKVNISEIVDDVVKEYNKSNSSMKVFHAAIQIPKELRTEKEIESYFKEGDPTSHPTIKSYIYIAKQMKKLIKASYN
tara:strand:+ start:141 stop:1325 length:1185 start_codon:yes stop_codon:yes gene_type:complete